MLEQAVENVQAHLAALTERLENIEASVNISSVTGPSSVPGMPGVPGGPSPNAGRYAQAQQPQQQPSPRWDIDDMGMWSLVLNPLSTALHKFRVLAKFFLTRNENRSPSAMIVRRLCLDISFLLFVVGFARLVWRRSGVRRREVKAALIALLRAIFGIKHDERTSIDRGV